MRERATVAVLAVTGAVAAGCGGGAGVITVAAVTTPHSAASFHVPAGASVLHAGPGPVHALLRLAGYRVRIELRPNTPERRNRLTVSVRRRGRPVRAATVRLDAGMLDMAMGVASYRLGTGRKHMAVLPAWRMPGRWGLALTVTPPGSAPIRVVVVDAMSR